LAAKTNLDCLQQFRSVLIKQGVHHQTSKGGHGSDGLTAIRRRSAAHPWDRPRRRLGEELAAYIANKEAENQNETKTEIESHPFLVLKSGYIFRLHVNLLMLCNVICCDFLSLPTVTCNFCRISHLPQTVFPTLTSNQRGRSENRAPNRSSR